jgi:hypothetical protein
MAGARSSTCLQNNNSRSSFGLKDEGPQGMKLRVINSKIFVPDVRAGKFLLVSASRSPRMKQTLLSPDRKYSWPVGSYSSSSYDLGP